ncbi:glycine cleavage system protein R [Desulfosarcina ovata]|uniref:Amino acid-binding protein n=2 Tax=Desulfosarcina ovata TaxID=83564 RepID=A0A5K8A559_9BACT|nr:ACT domain-containing protein [Desulfosarcina ovata]BBO80330.1 amino acid-binding protein [Desulfosarcina ovata subsp. sediminis]BBO87723.1 amino acid-binding protein [Desulfosarcina ovata subsp. ovata]
MQKMIISVLGKDRPGIIAAVTRILFELDCNIENVSQTILQNEFSGIFIVSVSDALTDADLHRQLDQGLSPMSLHVYEKRITDTDDTVTSVNSEPFVVTTKGPDRKGLVAAITGVLAAHQVNVSNLQAVFKGGDDPNANIMIYEVDIPADADQQVLRQQLHEKANALDLDISIQHKLIFEAINRV